MPSFLETRNNRSADSLKGPRVYSTDLLPSLFDPAAADLSVERSARALKIKIITKGIVTLNCAHLITPMGVKLVARHPDLFDGEALLPAFRVGKETLREIGDMSDTEFAAQGIDTKQLQDHVAVLDGQLKTVMPWELGDVGERFRRAVIAGLSSDTSLISKELGDVGFRAIDRKQVIGAVQAMSLTEDSEMRTYIGTLPNNIQPIFRRYIYTCYHMVGTSVVQCETGTDLSPLSHFKAADVILASSDATPAQLSDEGIFLRAFMGHALDTIQAMMLPTQIIDAMSFRDAHALSAALRERGFQDKYEAILSACAQTLAISKPIEALDKLDPDAVAEIARQIATEFQRYIDQEVYRSREHDLDVADGYRALTDLSLDGLAAIPFIGQVVSAAQAVGHAGQAAKAGWTSYRTNDNARAFEAARARREEEIKEAVKRLKTGDSKKSQLLTAAAALTDIYQIRIRRR